MAPSPPAAPGAGSRAWGPGDRRRKLWGQVHFAHDYSGNWRWWWPRDGSRRSELGTSVGVRTPCENLAPQRAKVVICYQTGKVWEARGEPWQLSRGSGHGVDPGFPGRGNGPFPAELAGAGPRARPGPLAPPPRGQGCRTAPAAASLWEKQLAAPGSPARGDTTWSQAGH